MLFTEPRFLFLFLPIVIGLYYICPRVLKNTLLLLASIYFYAAGEKKGVLIVLGSIAFNYVMGLWIDRARKTGSARGLLTLGIAANLSGLAWFKYADFAVKNANALLPIFNLPQHPLPHVRLPIGISFFTFHAISYITDVWRKEVKAMRNLPGFALYIVLFPQLIAGPIIRYKIIFQQFNIGGAKGRRHSWDLFAEGVRRFIIGFGKKMLIANTAARTADSIFGVDPALLTPAAAWLGVACYTIQIYFDFSGYSDMAIGMGRMFGFIFPENFNFPYIASSITDFWRRWHMTLSSWFRDYLYIPLGGNRVPPWRVYLNLLIVFFLCGLWHGAMWTFVAWGLFHGVFLILERIGLKNFLDRRPILRHVYVLLVVMVGWVLFRAPTIEFAGHFLLRMAFVGGSAAPYTAMFWATRVLPVALVAGIIGSFPWLPAFKSAWERVAQNSLLSQFALRSAEIVCLSCVYFAAATLSAANTYNPFIYFRF